MELRAIIGKETGKKIEECDFRSIESYLNDLKKTGVLNEISYTNLNTIEDFKLSKVKDIGDLIEEVISISKSIGAKNLYIHVSNLTDPQSFYHYLSQNGFVLRDSKLIKDSKR